MSDAKDQTVAAALLRQAVGLHQAGRLNQAQTAYRRVLDLAPDSFDALHLLGVTHYQLGELDRAAELIGRAVARDASNPHALSNLGNVQRAQGQAEAALETYDRALSRAPDFAQAHFNRGGVLIELARFEEAVGSFDRALALEPGYAEAHGARGNALRSLRRLDAAKSSFDEAIRLRPDYANAFNNRGIVQLERYEFAAALKDFDAAIAASPKMAEAHYNRGRALFRLGRPKAALPCFEVAVELKPDYADAWYRRGDALVQLRRHAEALDSYDRAAVLDPAIEARYFARLPTAMQIADWSGFAERLAALSAAIAQRHVRPFSVLGLVDDPALQLEAARGRADGMYRSEAPVPATARGPKSRLRIGYFSADFRNHAMAMQLAGLFEHHDRARIELFGFSFSVGEPDEMGRRIRAAFDHTLEVEGKRAVEIAALARDLEIDIAVDLMGYTTHNRVEIFAQRAAPIQASYLGYPGTLGAGFMDYIIADATLIPPESARFYSEKLVYLPHSYQVNDDRREISARTYTREEQGLPEVGFVFCCFNNSYKITPATFDGWMRILAAVPGSVLWLVETSPAVTTNLRREAAARGIDPGRLVFAGFLPSAEHLSRHRLADLVLDTLPYNAHGTGSYALWAGVPVLTLPGRSMVARVGGSLLRAVGLPELITESRAEYEALAIGLARDPARLAALRARLAANRTTLPLFDTRLTTRHIEAAYAAMYDRLVAGLPPANIVVEP